MEAMTSEEYHDAGEAYSEAKQWPEALEAFETGSIIDKGKPIAGYWLYSMGYCYKKMQKLKAAEDCFKQGIAANSTYSPNYEELMRLYGYQQRYPEAVEMAEEANRLNPGSSEVLGSLAIAYDGVGRNNEACEIGTELIRLEPDKPVHYVNYGISLSIINRNTEALENFQKAVSIDPTYVRAHYNLGGYYLRNGGFDNALEEWKALTSLSPEYAATLKAEFTKITGMTPEERIESLETPRPTLPSPPISHSAVAANSGCGGQATLLLLTAVTLAVLLSR